MARNRTPLAKAHVSGAALKHPERYGNRTSNKLAQPIGDPYPGMTADQCAAWNELASALPWLNRAHRTLLRMTCYLVARLHNDPEFGVSASQTLSALLSKLGATPVDESRVMHLGDDEYDPDDKFFDRPH